MAFESPSTFLPAILKTVDGDQHGSVELTCEAKLLPVLHLLLRRLCPCKGSVNF